MAPDETDPWGGVSASPVEVDAAAWCERRDQSDWSDGDQAELDAWLAASSAHAVAFLRMSHIWSRADRLSALRHPMRHALASADSRPSGTVPRRVVAFLVAFAAVSAAVGYYVYRPSAELFATPVGGREVLTLADGSQVELNTDTAVRVHVDSKQRIVFLDRGEAYFQVKHDNTHPFTVVASGHRITDLGTKFSVREEDRGLRVALVEGRARIDASSGNTPSRSAILMPGDVALVTTDSLTISRHTTGELVNSLGWRHGVLIFDHTTLGEAAREVNRYSRKKLVVADAKAGRLMIGGTFATSNVDSIAEAAKDFFGLRVEDRGDEIVISR